MKELLTELAGSLESDDVDAQLHRALMEEGILIDKAGAGGERRRLKERVQDEPEASFRPEAVERALARTIKQVEAQISDLRRHAWAVLILFSLGVLVILGLIVTGFSTGRAARYIQGFAAIVPTGGVWMWYRHIHRQLALKTADLMKLAKLCLNPSGRTG